MNNVAPCSILVETVDSVLKNCPYIHSGLSLPVLGMGPGPLALGKLVAF